VPASAVYVLVADAAGALAHAAPLVAWGQRHAGLVAIVADGDGPEREALLAAGFDDVVTPPYTTRELLVRMRAVHRRVQRGTARGNRRRYGAFMIDVANHALSVDGVVLALSPIELAVMRALVDAAGRPLSRGELLEAAWGDGELAITERAVDNVILRLRRKLPRPGTLETVRGVGFRLTD
jgi:DNA-binding response OmpR family regulator